MTEQREDRIERDIHVAASAQQVWDVVSRPGWWINDGEIDDDPVLRTDGDLTVLTHPSWGDFTMRTVESDSPRRIVFRWRPAPSDAVSDDASTLIELTIADEPGGVRLRVVETGFSTLSEDPGVWAKQRDENVEGWQTELRLARDRVTAFRG